MKKYITDSWISVLKNPMYLFQCGRTSLVYKLKCQDEIIYIGKTQNGGRRIASHDRDSGWVFDNVECIEVPVNEQSSIEKYLIKHYKPMYNKQHNI